MKPIGSRTCFMDSTSAALQTCISRIYSHNRAVILDKIITGEVREFHIQ